MKVLLNMFFDVRQNGCWFEVYGDVGKCLTRKPTLAEVLDDIRAMAAGAELTDNFDVQLIDVLTPIATRAAYYACGICDHYHAVDFNGDCSADDARYTGEDLDNLHGLNEWDIVSVDQDGIDHDPA